MTQRFSPDQVRDPQQLYTLLASMQQQLDAAQREIATLRAGVASTQRATPLDLSKPLTVELSASTLLRIRDALSAGGVAELNVTQLMGQLIESQHATAQLASTVESLPSPRLLDVGTLGIVVAAGPSYTLYYVAEGNPRTWAGAIPLSAGGSGFMTLATDQDPVTGKKTWRKLDDLNIVIRPIGNPASSTQKWFLIGWDDGLGNPDSVQDFLWVDAEGRLATKFLTVFGDRDGAVKIKADPDAPAGTELFQLYNASEAVVIYMTQEGLLSVANLLAPLASITALNGGNIDLSGHLSLNASGGYIRILNYGGTLFPDYAYIISYPGDPNGAVSMPKGSLCLDTGLGKTWKNTTGSTVWVEL